MKKLYWSPFELGTIKQANDDPHGVEATSTLIYQVYNLLGGLGLTFKPAKYNKYDEAKSSLETEMTYLYQGVGLLHTFRVYYVKVTGKEGHLEGTEVEGYITGKDYFRLRQKKPDVFFKVITDLAPFKCFKDCEDAVEVELLPVKIIPIIDGTIDENFDKWELFEQDGYIYGKRMGKMYELVHEVTTFENIFTKHQVFYHSFTIGSGKKKGDVEVETIDPMEIAHLADGQQPNQVILSWQKCLSTRILQYKLERTNNGLSSTVENKVHRLLGGWKEEIHGA